MKRDARSATVHLLKLLSTMARRKDMSLSRRTAKLVGASEASFRCHIRIARAPFWGEGHTTALKNLQH